MNEVVQTEQPVHPMNNLLRMDRMPHIWCQGCGIAIAVTEKTELTLVNMAAASGNQCPNIQIALLTGAMSFSW